MYIYIYTHYIHIRNTIHYYSMIYANLCILGFYLDFPFIQFSGKQCFIDSPDLGHVQQDWDVRDGSFSPGARTCDQEVSQRRQEL